MRRFLATVFLTVLAVVALPTLATVASATSNPISHHESSPFYQEHVSYQYPSDRGDGNGNSSGDYGDGNDNRRCRGDQCRGSFSPGPFDRSPVDISHNQFCIGPNSCPPSDEKQPPKK